MGVMHLWKKWILSFPKSKNSIIAAGSLINLFNKDGDLLMVIVIGNEVKKVIWLSDIVQSEI